MKWRGPRWPRNTWCHTCRAYKCPLKWSPLLGHWYCYPHYDQETQAAERQLVAEIEEELANG